ncbi:MAG: carotenoid biosynthesis protein, partial [Chloroflexi bacterium]|nr:carotenoid biosynthesis protein [Chloroflexota bacterium]
MNRRIWLWISAVSLALFLYKGVIRLLLLPVVVLPDLPPGGIDVSTTLILISSFAHALYALGARHTLIFAALSAVISWTFEQVGVATGAIYGPYHYTDYLGFKLGHVPLLIPMAWFMMIYPSYVIANLIADGQP